MVLRDRRGEEQRDEDEYWARRHVERAEGPADDIRATGGLVSRMRAA